MRSFVAFSLLILFCCCYSGGNLLAGDTIAAPNHDFGSDRKALSLKDENVFGIQLDKLNLKSHGARNGKKLISLDVTDAVDIRDVIAEIAKSMGMGFVISPDVSGSLCIKFVKEDLSSIMRSLAAVIPIRYQLINNKLIVGPDLPYKELYNVSLLNNYYSFTMGGLHNNDRNAGGIIRQDKLSYSGDSWTSLLSGIKSIIGTGSRNQGVVVNRDAGIVVVNATASQHALIGEYIKNFSSMLSKQVRIRLVLVRLKTKDCCADFSLLGEFGKKIIDDNPGNPGQLLRFDSTDVLPKLKNLGIVDNLYSTDIIVSNNYNAVLSFVRNSACVHDTTPDSNREKYTQSELVLALQPAIDPDGKALSLSLSAMNVPYKLADLNKSGCSNFDQFMIDFANINTIFRIRQSETVLLRGVSASNVGAIGNNFAGGFENSLLLVEARVLE